MSAKELKERGFKFFKLLVNYSELTSVFFNFSQVSFVVIVLEMKNCVSYFASGKATILAQTLCQNHEGNKLLSFSFVHKNTLISTLKTLFNCKFSTNDYFNQIGQHVLQDKSVTLHISFKSNELHHPQ